MDHKTISVNLSNICIEVPFDIDYHSEMFYVLKELLIFFEDRENIKTHISTIYDEDKQILHHFQDGKLNESQYMSECQLDEIYEKLNEQFKQKGENND